jgi:NADH pyrophosphatase NudC (nudix superfamily)
MQFFALVAGFVESGESLEHCLVREAKRSALRSRICATS